MTRRAHREVRFMIRPFAKTIKTVAGVAGTAAVVVAALTVVPRVADALTNHAPVGALWGVTQKGDGLAVRGWAVDPDTSMSAKVRITLDGANTPIVIANQYSAAVRKQHPSYGSYRAFSAFLTPVPAGSHRVCAYAIGYPDTGTRYLLRCISLVVDYDPFGKLVAIAQKPGSLTFTGWALDPNQPTTSLLVTVSVDGASVVWGSAKLPRTDLTDVFPGAGPNHGFVLTAPVTEGEHKLCIKARNVGLGSASTVTITCRERTISYSPAGAITNVSQQPNGAVKISGWTSDPDTTSAIKAKLTSDTVAVGTTFTANQPTSAHGAHGFSVVVALPVSQYDPATRKFCLTGINYGTFGATRTVGCASKALNYNPSAQLVVAKQKSPGVQVSGWALDPDTSDPITVAVSLDGSVVKQITASGASTSKPGHGFSVLLSSTNGDHKVCVRALNVLAGTGSSAASCQTVTLDFNPLGKFTSATRFSTTSPAIKVTGWAIDPDTTAPIQVRTTVDGVASKTVTADLPVPDLATSHPGMGTLHGFSFGLPADELEHKVCIWAVNTLGGTADEFLGCKIIIAVHPKPPTAPQNVVATAGYGGAVVTWEAPASDGGAPWSGYTITSAPGGISVTADRSATTATVLGLKPNTTYTFSVVAKNVAGTSVAGTSNSTKTQTSPPPQTTPAPISTSRYIRNISGGTATDTAKMYAEGQADALANPSGHGYLVLLDIGGQDEQRGGVILSATIRFISYSALVTNMKAYVDGYASKQRASAPITIAIGTNNDVDVTSAAGANWANKVVDPVVAYATKYPGIVIAGANDIEPGFTATYTETKAWLAGYLGATSAPFVFNGSADGCSWTSTSSSCNNGWTAWGLFHLAGGASATRIINLPQIYNSTMAKQWRYISLTGVNGGKPRINFGGALTEWTACQQAGSCGSITGNNAWTEMWNQLRAEPKLVISSLPYSTDLRIDR